MALDLQKQQSILPPQLQEKPEERVLETLAQKQEERSRDDINKEPTIGPILPGSKRDQEQQDVVSTAAVIVTNELKGQEQTQQAEKQREMFKGAIAADLLNEEKEKQQQPIQDNSIQDDINKAAAIARKNQEKSSQETQNIIENTAKSNVPELSPQQQKDLSDINTKLNTTKADLDKAVKDVNELYKDANNSGLDQAWLEKMQKTIGEAVGLAKNQDINLKQLWSFLQAIQQEPTPTPQFQTAQQLHSSASTEKQNMMGQIETIHLALMNLQKIADQIKVCEKLEQDYKQQYEQQKASLQLAVDGKGAIPNPQAMDSLKYKLSELNTSMQKLQNLIKEANEKGTSIPTAKVTEIKKMQEQFIQYQQGFGELEKQQKPVQLKQEQEILQELFKEAKAAKEGGIDVSAEQIKQLEEHLETFIKIGGSDGKPMTSEEQQTNPIVDAVLKITGKSTEQSEDGSSVSNPNKQPISTRSEEKQEKQDGEKKEDETQQSSSSPRPSYRGST